MSAGSARPLWSTPRPRLLACCWLAAPSAPLHAHCPMLRTLLFLASMAGAASFRVTSVAASGHAVTPRTSRLGVPVLKESVDEKTEKTGKNDVGANVLKEVMAGEKSENLLKRVKDAGVAGAISYAAW